MSLARDEFSGAAAPSSACSTQEAELVAIATAYHPMFAGAKRLCEPIAKRSRAVTAAEVIRVPEGELVGYREGRQRGRVRSVSEGRVGPSVGT
jgi:hypothetical protein